MVFFAWCCKLTSKIFDFWIRKSYDKKEWRMRMLQNAKGMLDHAKQNHYAICHLNINNLEWTKYILEECQEKLAPVILGVSEGAAKYMGGYHVVTNLVKGLVDDLKITIPVALHLDHGSSVESCKQAIDAGFTSVMIDGSKYDLTTNIEMTKEVVDYAHPLGVSVEAEVGHIGGSEDNTSSTIAYAEVDDCVALVTETKIDFFAPALGSVHGIYKGEPKLNFERMETIKDLTGLPLVLHGGSGIPDDLIKRAIQCGICKLNINTDLQIVWSKAVRQFLEQQPEVYDPRKVIGAGESAIKQEIDRKIELLGCANRA